MFFFIASFPASTVTHGLPTHTPCLNVVCLCFGRSYCWHRRAQWTGGEGGTWRAGPGADFPQLAAWWANRIAGEEAEPVFVLHSRLRLLLKQSAGFLNTHTHPAKINDWWSQKWYNAHAGLKAVQGVATHPVPNMSACNVSCLVIQFPLIVVL